VHKGPAGYGRTMTDRDTTPDDAPGTELPEPLEERDDEQRDRRPGERGKPGLGDLNDAIAPDGLSGPARPDDQRS
jgi:hypothetical protein